MAMAGDEHNQTLKAAHGDGTEQDLLAGLPDDLVADILHRVPPRWLAASRCVCKAWHDAIDRSRILRADLLPLSLAGLFVHFERHKYPEYLARPSSTAGRRAVSGDLSFLPFASPDCGSIWRKGVDFYDYHIRNHCNGLLLLTGNHVVNPATRRWHTLPTCPSEHHRRGVWYEKHLVYDPMLSPYYEVFSIPTFDTFEEEDEEVDPWMEGSEWPPSLCKIYVYSSKSGHWVEKDFTREGDAAGTVAEMRAGYNQLRSIYSQGAIYVHCGENSITRVALSSNTYSVIKPPMDLKAECDPDTSISRSKKGVYFVALYKRWIRVWILDESSGQMEWMLKHDKNVPRHRADQRIHAPWILKDINYNLFRSSHSRDDNNKPPSREIFEWNSDDDNGVENEKMAEHCDSEDNQDSYRDIEILGFHPYKEIVFLSESAQTGLAYHLHSSKVEVLGRIYPKDYCYFKDFNNELEEITSFPYTPCWIEEF